jgi:hypothetical protein
MENSRLPDQQQNNRSQEGGTANQQVNNQPNDLEGMNVEQQRGSLKNSDYGGAIKNTRSGRNSSDVSQDELKD